MTMKKTLVGPHAKTPLDDIQPEILSRLSADQKEILELRFTTLLSRKSMAKEIGITSQRLVAEENRALRLLSLPVIPKANKSEPDTPTLAISALSPICQGLLAYIGSEALLILMREFGGTRIHIPLHVRAEHRMAELLGMETFKKLAGYCGGELVYFPKQTLSKKALRNEQIYMKYVGGQKIASIAAEVGLSDRHISYLLAKQRNNNRGQVASCVK